MSYEIPQKLQYTEKLFFNLDFRQIVWISLFLCIGGFFWVVLPVPFEFRVGIIACCLLVGAGFAFLNFDRVLLNFFNYKRGLKEAGYMDKELNSLVGVEKIEDDLVYLSNKGIRAVLEVTPINFDILSVKERNAIISSYRDFLNSLDFSIQIIVRTANINLDNYFLNLKDKVVKQNNEKLFEQFEAFETFTKNFISKNAVRNRLFYIVVPFGINASRNMGFDLVVGLKNLFSKNKQLSSLGRAKQNCFDELDNRCNVLIEKLGKANLFTRRLNSNELVSLYSTFFESHVVIDEDYFSPAIILDAWSETEKYEEEKWVDAYGAPVK